MSTAYQIVICAGIVPDPLQTLEPIASPTGPALKNEMMLRFSPEYTFSGGAQPGPVHLEICEVLQPGWTQSFPASTCYTRDFTPVAGSFDSFENLDFGNWQPVDVTACKVRDLDGVPGGMTVPVPGWSVSLTREGVVVDTQKTGANACYTWTGLSPGFSYDLHEKMEPGWEALGPTDVVFPKAKSNDGFSYTFVNAVLQGCTPGFWQGGSAGGQAGGQWLWNEVNDPQWVASGGIPYNPYIHDTGFCSYFGCVESENMWYYVNPHMWSINNDFHKAARSLTAAYLNASCCRNGAAVRSRKHQHQSPLHLHGAVGRLLQPVDAGQWRYVLSGRCPLGDRGPLCQFSRLQSQNRLYHDLRETGLPFAVLSRSNVQLVSLSSPDADGGGVD